jgi:hypothetical protein
MKTSDGDLKCEHASITAVKWKYDWDVYPSAEFDKVMIATANKRSVSEEFKRNTSPIQLCSSK